jgi:hypothetical protein
MHLNQTAVVDPMCIVLPDCVQEDAMAAFPAAMLYVSHNLVQNCLLPSHCSRQPCTPPGRLRACTLTMAAGCPITGWFDRAIIKLAVDADDSNRLMLAILLTIATQVEALRLREQQQALPWLAELLEGGQQQRATQLQEVSSDLQHFWEMPAQHLLPDTKCEQGFG